MLLRRCAWCGRLLGLRWAGLRQWGVTHGMCRACYAGAVGGQRGRRG